MAAPTDIEAVDDRRPVRVHRHGGFRHAHPRSAITHAHVGLSFVESGEAELELAGRWRLGAGDVVLVPAGMPHRPLASTDAVMRSVGFCPVCVAAEGAAELLAPFEAVRSGHAAVARVAPERWPFVGMLFDELERESAVIAGVSVPRSLLTLLVAEVSRSRPSEALVPGTGLPALATEALRFIERHCLEGISAKDVARAVRRTPEHLTTVLRQSTGRTAQAWIIAGRLSEARRRLLHGEEDVDVIANRIGYADPTHFIRLFRREHGATPAAWRRAQLEGR